MGNIRVAILANTLKHGGIERVVVSLANELAKSGFDLTLILRKKRGEYADDISDAVHIIELGSDSMARCFFPLINTIKRGQFDVILSNGDQQNIAICLVKWFFAKKTKLVLVEHNDPFLSAAGTNSWRTSALRAFRRSLFKQADHIVAVSDGVRTSLVERLGCRPEKTSRIYNPVPISRIRQLALEDCDHPWISDRTIPLFVAVGRLHAQKGFDDLIAAFDIARRKRPSRLLLLGDGPARASLERLVADRDLQQHVDMPGFDTNPYRYLARSDAFVLSSLWEGFAIVVAEALACGTRVVATNCMSGPAEILNDGEYGTLVPPGDTDALAEAMLAAIDMPLDRQKNISRAEDFEVENSLKMYRSLINRVAA